MAKKISRDSHFIVRPDVLLKSMLAIEEKPWATNHTLNPPITATGWYFSSNAYFKAIILHPSSRPLYF